MRAPRRSSGRANPTKPPLPRPSAMFVTIAARPRLAALSSKSRREGKPSTQLGCSAAGLLAEGTTRHVAEQRHMGVVGDPILADPAARQRHRRAAGALVRQAVLVIAGRIEDAHADREEPVGRDERADVVHAVAEAGGDRPDVAPLRALDGVAAGDEILKGAEGDHVLGEEPVRTGEIDRLHVLRETPEPGLNALEIIRIGWRDHSITSNLLDFCRDVSTEPS